jgi:hypothetical protein
VEALGEVSREDVGQPSHGVAANEEGVWVLEGQTFQALVAMGWSGQVVSDSIQQASGG